MDYSEIKTLEQAIQVIKDLEKLVKKQEEYIEELEDNQDTSILDNLQGTIVSLEKEVTRYEEVFDLVGIQPSRIFTMSVYDAMCLDDFMKGFWSGIYFTVDFSISHPVYLIIL